MTAAGTAPITLPAVLRGKLAALARQVRCLRLYRGISLVLLVAAVAVTGVFLADLAWDLANESLAWLLTITVSLVALTILLGCVWPLCRRVDQEALAALIEQRYPELGERLTSSVELTTQAGRGHGARALIALLLQETAKKTETLEFGQALSPRSGRISLGLALIALLIALVPLAWGERFNDFGQRFALSWWAPRALSIEVSPGDGIAALGRTWTVSASVYQHDERVSLPRTAFLVLTDGHQQTTRLQMVANAPGRFSYTLDRVPGTLRYHIESGRAVSADYQLTAIQPVELAAGSPTITITPPAYVNRDVHPEQTVTASSNVTPLEFSNVRVNLRFNRPALRGHALLIPRVTTESKDEQPTWTLPLELVKDQPAGSVQVPALAPGTYRLKLHLEAEHGIASAYDLPELAIWRDEPPQFTERPRVFGVKPGEVRKDWAVQVDPTGGKFDPVQGGIQAPLAQRVTPTDTLKLKVGVEDKVGLDKVELQYRINAGPVQVELMARGDGQLTLALEHPFALKNRVKEGDIVLYRLKASDNRRVPREAHRDPTGQPVPRQELHPHIIYHPEPQNGKERWFLLRVDRSADSLAKQEILAQREEVRQKLAEIQKKLVQERADLKKVEQSSKAQPKWTEAQTQALDRVREQNRTISGELQQLAVETVKTPPLQNLATRIHEVAEKEMTQSDQALKQAEQKKEEPAQRQPQLERADQQLARAQKKIEELQKQNEQVAADRLAQQHLEELAQREKELAKKAADLEGVDQRDPRAQGELDRVRAEQQQIQDELKKLAEQSDLLKDALKAAQAEQAKKLAAKAADLAREQQDLARNADTMKRHMDQQRLADLAQRQAELAKQAGQVGQKTEPTAKEAATRPLNAEPAKMAAEELKKGEPLAALAQQDQAARELERLAQEIEQMLELDRIRKLAGGKFTDAAKLAAAQKALLERLKDEGAQVAVKINRPDEIRKAIDAIRKGQEAIAQATEKLPVTPQLQQLRKEATEQTTGAARDLGRRDPLNAFFKMEKALEALEALALQKVPMPTDPATQAAQLAKEQRDLAQATQNAEGEPQKMPALAKQQQNLNQQAQQLPRAPALDRAQQAMQKAEMALVKKNADEAFRRQQEAADALDELARDQKAQQAQAELARNDRVADATKMLKDLAQAQKDLREEVARLANANPMLPPGNPLGDLAQKQADLAKQANDLAKQVGQAGDKSPAAQQAQQAAQAAQKAAEQMQQGPTAQAQQQGEKAGQQLQQLAKDIATAMKSGDLAKADELLKRAQQLAEEQAELTREFRKLAGDPAAKQAQQLAKQEALQQQTGELMKDLQNLAQAKETPQPAQMPAKDAAQAAQQAQQAQEQAQKQAQQGNAQQMKQAGEQAAKMLQQAANQAKQAAEQLGKMLGQGEKPGNQPGQKAGQALQQGQEQMQQAQKNLAQGKGQKAGQAMDKAAQALQQAAEQASQQLAQQNQSTLPGQPTENKFSGPVGAAGFGSPDLKAYGPEAAKYAGKNWGQLPGELRTRILQDIRGRYGDDYAAVIQRYFEQIADTNSRRE